MRVGARLGYAAQMRAPRAAWWSLAAALLGGCAQIETAAREADAARPCEGGARRCVGRATQICTRDGLWGVPASCAKGESCGEGACMLTCEGCAPGDTRCAPEGLQRCVAGPDDCGAWTPPEPCPEGACRDGACVTDCPAPCTPFSRSR